MHSHTLPSAPFQTSVVTLALGLVTFTPSAFAFAMISILFRDDTACAILFRSVRVD